MKFLLALVTLSLSLTTFAQESVILNAAEISVNSDSAIFVRTSSSPSKISATFRVRMAHSVCEEYGVRTVLVTSGARCGYDTRLQRVRVGKECALYNAENVCTRWKDDYQMQHVQVPRTCYVQETFCTRFGTAYSTKADNMTLAFKNLPALGGSETETFLVTAQQKSYDSGSVVFEVVPKKTLGTYKVKKKKTFLGIGNDDDLVVSPK